MQCEELKVLAKNLYFQTMVKGIVDERVNAALGEQNKTPQAKVMKKGNDTTYVKKTIHNPKSPSDTTIYAPALNLTPEKRAVNEISGMQPSDRQIT